MKIIRQGMMMNRFLKFKNTAFWLLPILIFIACSDDSPTLGNEGLNSTDSGDSRSCHYSLTNTPNVGDGTLECPEKIYKTVTMAEIVWMAENLNYGELIEGSNHQQDASSNSVDKYCFNDDEVNCDTYGGLYQWHTAMALPQSCNHTLIGEGECVMYENHQGVCPDGWHIPDWETEVMWMKFYVDSENEGTEFNAGYSLKSTSGWEGISANGEDLYGWGGLPAGVLNQAGSSEFQFDSVNTLGTWWTTGTSGLASYEDLGLSYMVYSSNTELNSFHVSRNDRAASIRCVLGEQSTKSLNQEIPQSSSSTLGSSSSSSDESSSICDGPSIMDSRDGMTYKTVQVGSQNWMAENLNFGVQVNALDGNGDAGNSQADASEESAEKWCYLDSSNLCESDGALYQWHTAMALPANCNYSRAITDECVISKPHRGICPIGWHIPDDGEWSELKSSVDNENGGVFKDEGNSLKSSLGWNSGAGDNSSGWDAIAPGVLRPSGFVNRTYYANWWSTIEIDEENGLSWQLGHDFTDLRSFDRSKADVGFSVRCVQDQ